MTDKQGAKYWPQIYVAMKRGAVLVKHNELIYYTRCLEANDPYNCLGISAEIVDFQVAHGALVRINNETVGLKAAYQEQVEVQQSLF
ncbi:hypothetical protein KI809_15570 [Geobacter pelophilus]|uniref:Uncharacterized protein n=1 Tax=Geoanaerobacter pelophilus TaxID=60036 RepID=A0AAW4L4B1_9BACT|nr:hypothetical protein [Geoanaerobacter pelophilus]MBT0665728.1 hypothetical protein [Geoanaerobacter pelophilus]